MTGLLDVVDWRRRVFALYAEVRERAAADPEDAHSHWRAGRDKLVAHHPARPLLPEDRAAFDGLPVADYDPAYRFEVAIGRAGIEGSAGATTPSVSFVPRAARLDAAIPFDLIGRVTLPGLGRLDVWSLRSYGGGIFVPVKDSLAGSLTYGAGRYVLDTVKGADLGETSARELVVDLNFAYNPSCAYDPSWSCPLAPRGNVLGAPVPVGEQAPRSSPRSRAT